MSQWKKEIEDRSKGKCELCGGIEDLQIYEVPPKNNIGADGSAHLCIICRTQIDQPGAEETNHWRCLNGAMWSEIPAIQVLAWRMLSRLKGEGWPGELLEMLILEDELLSWAKATNEDSNEDKVEHTDSNGNVLQPGDTVVLIKDLKVKGGNFTAKRGTAVRRISLVSDNTEYIEGKIEGQQIVILTQYVKKS